FAGTALRVLRTKVPDPFFKPRRHTSGRLTEGMTMSTRRKATFRPQLEMLEERLAPALTPLQTGATGRFLVDGSGTPLLLKGDAAWSLISATTFSEADQYLADRQSRGFDMVLVNLVEHKFAPNAPADLAGDFPFFNPATGSHQAFIDPINPNYFA